MQAPGGEVVFANPGEREEMYDQLGAMIEVKAEFMPPPYSTWTAVCVDRHYSDNTIIEIQMTAYAPVAKK